MQRLSLRYRNNLEALTSISGEFVHGKPIRNAWERLTSIPCNTPESDAMSKDLQKRGFKFVGTTICYAFMQAVGMVNDHVISCFRYRDLNK